MINLFSLLLLITCFLTCRPDDRVRSEAITLNNYAIDLLTRDNLDSAAFLLEKAIQKDSTYYTAYSNLSTVRMRQHKSNDALEIMKSAFRVKPDLAESAVWIGMFYEHQSDHTNSKPYFDTALSLYNKRIALRDSCDNRINRAFVFLWLNDTTNANADAKWIGNAQCDTFMLGLLKNFRKTDWLKTFD